MPTSLTYLFLSKVAFSFCLINSLRLITFCSVHKKITKEILMTLIKGNKLLTPICTKALQCLDKNFSRVVFDLEFVSGFFTSLFLSLHASKIVLQDPRDRKTVGRWESAQNLNSRSLTVADHGIQAMPPRRVLLNELKITGPRLFLGQSSVHADVLPRSMNRSRT